MKMIFFHIVQRSEPLAISFGAASMLRRVGTLYGAIGINSSIVIFFGKLLFQLMLTQLHWPFALQECLALYSSCHIVYLGKASLQSFFFSGSVLIHKHSWILSDSILFLLEYYMMTQLVPLLPLQALIQTCDNANLLSQFSALVFIFP